MNASGEKIYENLTGFQSSLDFKIMDIGVWTCSNFLPNRKDGKMPFWPYYVARQHNKDFCVFLIRYNNLEYLKCTATQWSNCYHKNNSVGYAMTWKDVHKNKKKQFREQYYYIILSFYLKRGRVEIIATGYKSKHSGYVWLLKL